MRERERERERESGRLLYVVYNILVKWVGGWRKKRDGERNQRK